MTRLVAGLTLLALLAFASMASTLWLAASVEGDARAINEAGALRMSTYRLLAATRETPAPGAMPGASEPRAAYWRQDFHQRLQSPTLRSALPQDPTHAVNDAFGAVQTAWARSPLAADQTATLAQVQELVDVIDHFVLALETHSERKLTLIRLTLWTFAALAALVVTGLGIWLWRAMIRPLGKLTTQAQALEQTQLQVRSQLQGHDELAILSQSLDRMAAELEAIYADMQSQIDERTRTLADERARAALKDERSVIARELHDSLAQTLTYQKMQLALLQAHLQAHYSDDPEWQPTLTALRSNVNESYRKLRELLSTFRLQLNHRSLDEALTATIDELQPNTRTRLAVRGAFGDMRLSPQREIHVLHIMREALTNVIRHANASRAEVSIEHSGRHATVRIRDNGSGFAEPSPEDGHGHWGLGILYERSAQLKGQLTIHPRQDQPGTEVLLQFEAEG